MGSIKQKISLAGSLVSYQENATNDGDNVILLHGWRSEANALLGMFRALTQKGYNVYALDLPGFGGSPMVPGAEFDLSDYVAVVIDFIRKKQLEGATIVGHSFGGRIAIKLSSHYPDLVSKIVLVNAAGFISKHTLKNKIASKVRRLFAPKFMQPVRKAIYKAMGAEDYVATPELRETFKKIVTEDLTENMKSISIPTLLIWGSNDKITPLSFAKRMNELIQNSKLVVIEGAGHFSFIDDEERFNRELIQFLNNDS